MGTEPIRVLHVDDDPTFADLAATLLEREDDDITVVGERRAVDGIDRLRREAVDCVVSDYQMPGTDGLEFLKAVREDYPDLPFVLFTGCGSEEIASEAISTGVDDYIQKSGGSEQYTLLANRIRNLVDRRRTRQELAIKNRAMDAAPVGIVLTDPDRDDNPIVYANEQFRTLTGYSEREIVGRNCRLLQGPETDPEAVAELREAIDAERTVSGALLNYTREGKSFWNRITVAPVYDADGTLTRFVGFQRDVTEHKEARLELRRILDRMSDAFFAVDAEWRFTYLNGEAETVLERDRDDVVGECLWEEFPEARGTTFHERYHEAMERQEPVTFEAYYPPLETQFEVRAYPSQTGLSVYFRGE